MSHLIPSPELAAAVRRRVDELRPNSLGDWPTRVCKEELNALPLHGNVVYLWALRPDGTILCMDHEAFNHPTEPETDPLIIYAVLAQGARIYPELQSWVPPRPAGAQQCDVCQGSGTKQSDGAITHCFKCRSLGWFIPGNIPDRS